MTELPPKKLLDIPVEILARRQDTGEWVLYAVVDSFHYTVTEPVIARAYADGYDGIRIRTQGSVPSWPMTRAMRCRPKRSN